MIRGRVRPPEGFTMGKAEAEKLRGRSPHGFAAKGLPKENPEGALTLPQSEAPKGTLVRGHFFHIAQRIFNSCSKSCGSLEGILALSASSHCVFMPFFQE